MLPPLFMINSRIPQRIRKRRFEFLFKKREIETIGKAYQQYRH